MADEGGSRLGLFGEPRTRDDGDSSTGPDGEVVGQHEAEPAVEKNGESKPRGGGLIRLGSGPDGMLLDLRPSSPPVVVPSDGSRRAVRAFDLVVGIPAFIVTMPLMLVIASLIRVSSGPGVIFAQERVGRRSQTFTCFKFRTMILDAEDVLSNDPVLAEEYGTSYKLIEDPRVTSVGAWLRRFSLDELPQLFNVIRGDMSIVGPRPMIPPETVRYGEWIDQVLEVKPGLAGLWQVSGRSDLTYEERVDIDVKYAVTRTLRMDIVLCFQTVFKMFCRSSGAY